MIELMKYKPERIIRNWAGCMLYHCGGIYYTAVFVENDPFTGYWIEAQSDYEAIGACKKVWWAKKEDDFDGSFIMPIDDNIYLEGRNIAPKSFHQNNYAEMMRELGPEIEALFNALFNRPIE